MDSSLLFYNVIKKIAYRCSSVTEMLSAYNTICLHVGFIQISVDETSVLVAAILFTEMTQTQGS